MLKTPKFWLEKNLISVALFPLSLIYFLIFFIIKIFSKPQKISKPIICVGNLIAGGSGKTPTAIALGKVIKEMKVSFAYLSRGYMNDGAEFLMLRKEDNNKANQVGDEPMMLLETAATFVAKDRLFGAKMIESMNKFQAIVLDDGMQNNRLKSDYNILVVDGKIGFGNGFMIPAGPMREPLCLGLKKADLVVLIGEASDELNKILNNKKIVKAKIFATNSQEFLGKKLIAFCGLAFPEKFFSLLKELGLEVLESYGFADHHNYKIHELEALYQKAKEQNAVLIATKKDWVKFPKVFQEKISYLDVELKFENDDLLKKELKNILKC